MAGTNGRGRRDNEGGASGAGNGKEQPMDRQDGLVVSDLSVTYGSHRALIDASLAIAPGQVTAVLGPSGSGKSSLLRAVAGLEPPAGGRVLVGGEDVTALPPHARGFGMMFQSGALFPHLSVGGNVAYGIAHGPHKLPADQRKQRVEELLDLVGLSGYASRAVSTLSGGQAQRVALARSLAPQPQVLLLDEPLSALDRSLRERLSVELRRIMTTAGVAGLYVTHDQDEAFTVADRLAVLIDARVTREGPTREVWEDPRRADVAEFLGYRPLVKREVAAQWGIPAPEGADTLALAPGALTLGPDAAGDLVIDAQASGGRDVRGAREVALQIPGVGDATARAPLGWQEPSGGAVCAHLDARRTAWVTA
ncbi:MAG: ABC transporter ATP-binding protein [Actinomycetaceae bacterium]|nr:ABC transporter ATP-binding protein [Actinomycetaceae bacterium]MDU0970862.1 ABC transporter ATP-binding protein [Actinomycetaceae bacterium]